MDLSMVHEEACGGSPEAPTAEADVEHLVFKKEGMKTSKEQ